MALEPNFRLSESELLKFHFAIKRLFKSEPIQYILGETLFHGLRLEVNPKVLIPRPETEELVNMVIRENFDDKRILDIGTGSGCIAIALKNKLSNCKVTGLDISEAALETAKKNATINKVDVEFIQADIRESGKFSSLGIFNVIVSNPPYVTHEDRSQMSNNVLEWEPEKALFAPVDDPLYFYKKILEFSNYHLSGKGKLFLEINENYGLELKELIKEYSFTQVILYQDFRGKNRFIIAKK